MSPAEEIALTLDLDGTPSVAILHHPAEPSGLGVVIVVGGPQTRVGPHRQFVALARRLAAAGHAVLRFDHRGIGDTSAPHPGFERIRPDIQAAIETLRQQVPEARRLVLWGLCDSVPAICAHAAQDARIAGIVLVNPWVRDAATQDTALIRHYYLRRPLQREFWRNLRRGHSDVTDFLRRSLRSLGHALRRKARSLLRPPAPARPASLAGRLVADLGRFDGAVRLVVSGHDITAREFETAAAAQPGWRRIADKPGFSRLAVETADHTFTERADMDQLVATTLAWLDQLADAPDRTDRPVTRPPAALADPRPEHRASAVAAPLQTKSPMS